MAPPSVDFTPTTNNGASSKPHYTSQLNEPLQYSGSLDQYESFDLTATIGREFSTLQLSEILHDDVKIRDLGTISQYALPTWRSGEDRSVNAKSVSRRGVVFFRNQDLKIEDQKTLAVKIGHLTGRPETSYLHKHPLANSKRGVAVDEHGKVDDEITIMSSEQNKKYYKDRCGPSTKRLASEGWHSELRLFYPVYSIMPMS